jgi:hypothetical protein
MAQQPNSAALSRRLLDRSCTRFAELKVIQSRNAANTLTKCMAVHREHTRI